MKSNKQLFAVACSLFVWQTFAPSGLAADPKTAPTVDSVLEKYAAALGGKEKIEKIKSRVQKGKFVLFGQDAPLAQFYKGPNQFFSELKIEGVGEFAEGVDGQTAWSKEPSGVRVKESAEAARAKREATLHREIKLKSLLPALAYKGSEKLGAEDVVILESQAGGIKDRYHFSANTGLLLSESSEFEGRDGGQVQVTIKYGNYTEAGGIKYPFERQLKLSGGFGEFEMTMVLTEVQHDVEIPDAKFTKPAE